MLAVTFLNLPTQAQDAGFDLQRFPPALDEHGFITMQSTRTPGHLRWTSSFWSTYFRHPLKLEEQVVVEDRVLFSAGFQLGLAERIALGVQIPWVLQDGAALDSAALSAAVPAPSSPALSDPRVVVRYQFLGEPADRLRDSKDGFRVAYQLGVHLPLGSERAYAGEQATRLQSHLLMDYHLLGAGAGLGLGWQHRFAKTEWGSDRLSDELNATLALDVPLPVARGLSALLEGRLATDPERPFQGNAVNVAEVDVGARYQLDAVSITSTLGTSFTEAYGSAPLRASLGLVYTPKIHDQDGDGIPDDQDECEELPEDMDGFQDADGCLDPDNDNDMVPDEDDRCPLEPADLERDKDEDGCTD